MADEDILYLSGTRQDDEILVPAQSLVALFTLQYCRDPAIKVVIVDKRHQSLSISGEHNNHHCNNDIVESNEDLSSWFPIDLHCLNFKVAVKGERECPSAVKNCALPLVTTSNVWFVAGLCSSLRFILNRTVEVNPQHYCRSLLGFRNGCLQACAEVSVWTKYCEIEIIKMIEKVKTNEFISDGKLELPKDILRFERHLQHPPIVHNALKTKQYHIRRTVKDKEEKQQLLQRRLADLPDLEHTYAEGLNMTLADILLYACFHIIIPKVQMFTSLDDISPLVMKWYTLIKSDENIRGAVSFLEKSLKIVCNDVEEKADALDIIIPEVPCESLYKSDPERYKPRWRAFTHQNDIDKCLKIIEVANIEPEYDCHPSGDNVCLSWTSFPSPVHPQEGNLPASRLERKCQQIENVVSAVQSLASDGDVIVDFCAGGGHVAIVLAYSLPKCKILLVENKDVSLLRAKKRVEDLKLRNVEFYQCNLDYFQGAFDVGVCLHACGVATDLVMQKCLEQRASFVCCPCCYGAVQPNHILKYPRSKDYSRLFVSINDYLTLGHAADQTHDENNVKTEQGQHCMRLVDNDRLLLAQSCGYSTKLVLMQPKTCSPKNHLLIGTPDA